MLVQLLAALYHASEYANKGFSYVKSVLRTTLGPEPQNFIIMDDGRIFASSVIIPDTVRNSAYFYNTHTKRITSLDQQEPDGRFRRLPYVSAVVHDDRSGTVNDLSDWIGDVRANPVPTQLHIKQYIQLWSMVHNQYIPGVGGRAVVTHSDGTEETVVL